MSFDAATMKGDRAAAEAGAAAAAPSAAEPVIIVRDVSKSYRMYPRPADRLRQAFAWGRKQYYEEFWALRDIHFEVGRGESVGIIGRNGSGKSTLLQIIAGTVAPTTGEASVRGRVAALLELGSGFHPEATGRENVFMNGAILGLSQEQIERRFDSIAAFADIGPFIEQPVKTYSSGMMMRLAFSVATAVEPEVLIVDEALAVGDMLFQHRCMERIRGLIDRGTTLLFVSHDPDAVRTLCRRGVWLEGGRQRMVGPAREVADEYMRGFAVQRNAAVIQSQRERDPAPAGPADDVFSPVEQAAETLDGGDAVSIESVRVLNAVGQEADALGPDERFTIECRLRSSRELNHLSVGFLIRNRHGLELTGESVFNKFQRGLRLPAGTTRTIRFQSDNVLRSGHYSVAVRVHRVSRWDRGDAVLLLSNEVATAFHVHHDPDQPMWFQFRQPFEVSIT